MEKKDIEVAFDKWVDSCNDLRNVCETYIMERINSSPNNEIAFGDNAPCVNYDGGNHPEYDSSMYSQVKKAYLSDGEIYLAIDETDKYEISRVDTERLFYVADAIGNE